MLNIQHIMTGIVGLSGLLLLIVLLIAAELLLCSPYVAGPRIRRGAWVAGSLLSLLLLGQFLARL